MRLRVTLQAYLSPIELCFPQYLGFKRRVSRTESARKTLQSRQSA